jgi:hypothetical protein
MAMRLACAAVVAGVKEGEEALALPQALVVGAIRLA